MNWWMTMKRNKGLPKEVLARTMFVEYIEAIKALIQDPEFMNRSKKKPQYFSRNRKMPFAKLIGFMLNMIKGSTQNCLNKFFELLDEDTFMTQQSFSEARQKIKWSAFYELFQMTAKLSYKGFFETWHGYRVMAVDGTKIQLPSDKKLSEHFGALGAKETAPTAQGSALYDVYNNVLIDAQIMPMSTGERELAQIHIDNLCSYEFFGKELILFDRGYASFELIAMLKSRNISFVMRVKRRFNHNIDIQTEPDGQVTLSKAGHPDITVRVLKFELDSGEMEMLITDISDKRMGIHAFKKLYFKRWPIETKYNEIKHKLELSNFSGRTVSNIKQDFYTTMFVSNIVAAACHEAQKTVSAERENKDNMYEYHVTLNDAIGTYKNCFFKTLLLFDVNKITQIIGRFLFLLTKHLTPTRPDRSVNRNKNSRNADFHHNQKSNC